MSQNFFDQISPLLDQFYQGFLSQQPWRLGTDSQDFTPQNRDQQGSSGLAKGYMLTGTPNGPVKQDVWYETSPGSASNGASPSGWIDSPGQSLSDATGKRPAVYLANPTGASSQASSSRTTPGLMGLNPWQPNQSDDPTNIWSLRNPYWSSWGIQGLASNGLMGMGPYGWGGQSPQDGRPRLGVPAGASGVSKYTSDIPKNDAASSLTKGVGGSMNGSKRDFSGLLSDLWRQQPMQSDIAGAIGINPSTGMYPMSYKGL
jgi:hypothetical protein